MRVLIESEHEAAWLEARFHAISYHLGPMVELTAVLPSGKVLHKPLGGLMPAARCASLLERFEDRQSLGDR
jgi:hypothetical protein